MTFALLDGSFFLCCQSAKLRWKRQNNSAAATLAASIFRIYVLGERPAEMTG